MESFTKNITAIIYRLLKDLKTKTQLFCIKANGTCYNTNRESKIYEQKKYKKSCRTSKSFINLFN